MKKKPAFVYFILFLIAAFAANFTFAEVKKVNIISSVTSPVDLQYWQITSDINPDSSPDNIPDSIWSEFPVKPTSEMSSGNWLVRTKIEIPDEKISSILWGAFPVYFLSAYEVFWDGKKIARNGKPGLDYGREEPGEYNYYIPLESSLMSKGEHTIVLRISNHRGGYSWKWYYGSFLLSPYEKGLKALFSTGFLSFFMIGIILIPFVFNLFLFFARKRKPEHLVFSSVCFLVIMDYIIYQLPVFFRLKTTFAGWSVYCFGTITVLFGILLLFFLLYVFRFPRKTEFVFITVILIVYFGFTNVLNQYKIMAFTVLALCSLLTAYAVFKKREGSVIIAAGLAASWFGTIFNYGFLSISTIMVFCSSFIIARQFSINERNEREAQLRSARLENELLKKNINPHFLLNTLTSVIAWFRREPDSAIRLIESLAEEFRIILQVSGLKLIPIEQEIELCKTHLRVMSLRKGADYRLQTEGILQGEQVPPMIFHTLIENGLSHGYEKKLSGAFIIKRLRKEDRVVYSISNDGDFCGESKTGSTGFGLKYIQSRLDESFRHRWTARSNKLENGWENIIEIRDSG
jgi:hypothetical protein